MLIVFLAFRRNVSILVVKHPKHVFVHYSETMKAEVPSYRLHQENIERGSSGSWVGLDDCYVGVGNTCQITRSQDLYLL